MNVLGAALCAVLVCVGAIALSAAIGLCVAVMFIVATWVLERFGGR